MHSHGPIVPYNASAKERVVDKERIVDHFPSHNHLHVHPRVTSQTRES